MTDKEKIASRYKEITQEEKTYFKQFFENCPHAVLLEYISGKTEWNYDALQIAIEVFDRTSFDGHRIYVGMKIYHIYGKSLRESEVVAILDAKEGCLYENRIKVKGLKKLINANNILLKQ